MRKQVVGVCVCVHACARPLRSQSLGSQSQGPQPGTRLAQPQLYPVFLPLAALHSPGLPGLWGQRPEQAWEALSTPPGGTAFLGPSGRQGLVWAGSRATAEALRAGGGSSLSLRCRGRSWRLVRTEALT